MRSGVSFQTISVEKMADTDLRHEILTSSPPETPDRRTPRSQAHQKTGGKTGQGKGRDKDKKNGGYDTPTKRPKGGGKGGRAKRDRSWDRDREYDSWNYEDGQNWGRKQQNWNNWNKKQRGGRWGNGR